MKRILLKSFGLMAGMAMGCFEKPTPVYGVPDTGYMDADDDGWPAGEDCDDEDPAVNPEAEEICDDAIDNDCDGDEDADDPDCAA